ncbi:PH domain-like protein [Lizonia empirigonia]|nr:PH domain-like protein [Lizonia empirigonia]
MVEGAQQSSAPSLPAHRPMAAMKLTTPAFSTTHTPALSAAVMSPVNQDGCFEFDRIVKAGSVLKRTRKTKQWKPVYLVLRPNGLSIYKDKDETKLRHQINLAEITAVARQKDSKKKMDHVFGIFSPARNYHLGASTDREAQAWVHLIRAQARIDEEEGELILLSPTVAPAVDPLHRTHAHTLSSSSEAEPAFTSSSLPRAAHPAPMHSARRPSQALNYSGNEQGSTSNLHLPPATSDSDPDRVVFHGWLYVLKSKGGVRQWKKVWVVLRPRCLALYKSADEYSAHLIIPFATVIDAVDIDSVSRSKQYCMQVLTDEKNFRFCAKSENELAKWLGAFKSLLVRRREGEAKRPGKTPTLLGSRIGK